MHIFKKPAIYFQSDDGAGNGGGGGEGGEGKPAPATPAPSTDDSSGKGPSNDDSGSKELEARLNKLADETTYLRTELKKVVSQRDEAKARARELERNGAEGSGDIETLKKSFLEEKQSLEQKLQEIQAKNAEITNQFHTTLTKDKLRSLVSGQVAESAFETFFFENGQLFDVNEKGELVSKDGIRTPAEAIKKIVTDKPFYAAVAKSKHSGMPGASDETHELVPDGFYDTWTDNQRREWAAKQPRDVRRKVGEMITKRG